MSRYAGLRQRVPTAIALAVALLLVLFALPAVFTTVLVALVVLSGAWEWSAFLKLQQALWRHAYVLLVGVTCLAAWQYSRAPGALSLLMGIAAIWWLVAFAWVMFAPTRGGRGVTAIAGLCVMVPAGVALQHLRFEDNGAWVLLFALVVVMRRRRVSRCATCGVTFCKTSRKRSIARSKSCTPIACVCA
ncbi:MAG: hypothetical protein EB048_12240 [Gammaproteobacteria bacterium]|nr:hypothetical protein [Gammaproteobacteria bacterium]